MPRKHDRPDPQVELWRIFVLERARLEAERLRAEETDLAAAQEIGQERRLRAWLLLALALTLAVGLAVGFALGSTRVERQPTPASAVPSPAMRSPATQPAPAPPTSVVVRRIVSSACLETARRADELIALLNRNRRSEAADLIVAYTVANRQCRKDASP